jgi:signal peptidase I
MSTSTSTVNTLTEDVVQAGQAVLRLLWLVVIPALLAGLTIRYLVPRSVTPKATGFENDLARWSLQDPVAFAVGVFLIFAVLAHYWRFYVPGGRFMAKLAPEQSARVPRSQLAPVAAAAELERSLADRKTRHRLEERLEDESLTTLDNQLGDLRAAIAAGEGRRTRALRRSVARLVAPALRLRQLALSASFVLGVGAAGWLVLFLRNNVFQSYRVLSESMLPTFQPGDYVGGNKRAYGLKLPWSKEPSHPSKPRRGDVVVFRMPDGDEVVKRVIGLPGDQVTMYRGRPVINGWLIPNCFAGSYLYLSPSGKAVTGRLSVEFLEDRAYLTAHTPVLERSEGFDVKPDEVFVLGDNRNASRDSRSFNRGTARSFNQGVGGGVAVGDILARVDDLVVHASRNGAFDLGTLFQPLAALKLNLDNVDTSPLERSIAACLGPEKRPKETYPPQAGAPNASAAATPGNVASRP